MSLSEYINEQFVGQDKSKQQILDEIYKAAKDAHNDMLGYIPQKPMALITVHDPKSSIIESIGFSEPDDIINNRFGALLAANFNNGNSSIIISDINNLSHTLIINAPLGPITYNRSNAGVAGVGLRMRVGKNGSALSVTRADFDLFDPFPFAPESGFFNITQGGWQTGSQTVVANGLLSNVTGTDVVGECGLYGVWNKSTGPDFQKVFMLSHDIAGVGFSPGQNINVTYTWTIT